MGWQASPAQTEVARFATRQALHILVQGAQGAGKTATGMRALLGWMTAECPPGNRHVIAYPDARQGLIELQGMAEEWRDESGFHIDLRAQSWKVESLHGNPHTVVMLPYGSARESGVKKFRNWNLASILVDEAPEMDALNRQALISRLRAVPTPRAVWCYNPDNRNGFKSALFEPIEAGELDGEIHVLRLTDNPSLPTGYEAMQRYNYPHAHERAIYIDGEWATPTGAVYPHRARRYDQHPDGRVVPHPTEEPLDLYVGLDDGAGTVTHAVLLAHYGHRVVVIDEWQHDRRREGEMTTPARAESIVRHFARHGPIAGWTIDRTAGDMMVQIRLKVDGHVGGSIGEIDPTIRHVARFFDQEWLWLSENCPKTIDGIGRYTWPENHETWGPVRPVKRDDHEADSVRYGLCKLAPLTMVRSSA